MNSRFSLLFKILTLSGLIIVMLIPMTMIMGVIEDSSYYQQSVINSVAQSSSYSQTIVGLIIVVPYTETTLEFRDKQKYYVQNKYVRYVLPQKLDVNANADISARHIGIYQAPVYQADLKFSGSFDPISLDSLQNNENVAIDDPYLIVLISDTRGIMQVPLMNLNGNKDMGFEPGVNQSGISSAQGIHTAISLAELTTTKLDFDFSLQLQGTKELSVVPVGRSSSYSLKGNWPHPNFVGYTLPTQRQITDKGFGSTWQSSWYVNNINSLFANDVRLTRNELNYSDNLPAFKASFVETVDEYQMTERAVKYDILFIVLTFICFFIFEMLKQLKIHPV